METAEAIRGQVEHEQRVIVRLTTATTRFSDAQLERMWAIKSAHEQGLSIRQIAGVTGLSSSSVHQVLNSKDLPRIPRWATDLRDTARKGDYLTAEVKLLRQCVHWLKQLENGEDAFVNLRPDNDPERDYVRFDRTRIGAHTGTNRRRPRSIRRRLAPTSAERRCKRTQTQAYACAAGEAKTLDARAEKRFTSRAQAASKVTVSALQKSLQKARLLQPSFAAKKANQFGSS